MIAAAASVLGREHARLGRNNQDGFACGSGVAVVTDGCSSQPRSEVGAALGARFLSRWLQGREVTAALPAEATAALTTWLAQTVALLGDASALETHFLFTFLCAVHREGQAVVFGLGDGAFAVDGALVRLDPGPENAPPYVAYRLVDAGRRPEPELHFLGEATRVAVMTDGLERLAPERLLALLDDPVLSRNPTHLQRRLNVLHEAERFADDATLAVLGR